MMNRRVIDGEFLIVSKECMDYGHKNGQKDEKFESFIFFEEHF